MRNLILALVMVVISLASLAEARPRIFARRSYSSGCNSCANGNCQQQIQLPVAQPAKQVVVQQDNYYPQQCSKNTCNKDTCCDCKCGCKDCKCSKECCKDNKGNCDCKCGCKDCTCNKLPPIPNAPKKVKIKVQVQQNTCANGNCSSYNYQYNYQQQPMRVGPVRRIIKKIFHR